MSSRLCADRLSTARAAPSALASRIALSQISPTPAKSESLADSSTELEYPLTAARTLTTVSCFQGAQPRSMRPTDLVASRRLGRLLAVQRRCIGTRIFRVALRPVTSSFIRLLGRAIALLSGATGTAGGILRLVLLRRHIGPPGDKPGVGGPAGSGSPLAAADNPGR